MKWPVKHGALGWLVCSAACVYLFYDVAHFHSGFDVRYRGIYSLDTSELVFYAWYGFYGSLSVLFTSLAFGGWVGTDRLVRAIRGALEEPAKLAVVAAVAAFACSLAFRSAFLLNEPIADDESTYLLIAQTLLEGRLQNPLGVPGDFLRNQFVVVTDHHWYGKYPIGHPLLLAVAELFGGRALVGPLMGGATVWLTFLVGRRMFEPRVAALAAALLVLSPQFVWTNGTLMSQPTNTVFMLLGLLSLLRLQESGQARWAVAAGAALGYGVLVRPMPSALFVVAAFAAHVFGRSDQQNRGWTTKLRALLAGAPGIVIAGALILGVNFIQTGDPLRSGYHVYHSGVDASTGVAGHAGASLGGGLLRQAVWLLGWPLAMGFALLARPRRGGLLFVGFILAECAYRVLFPRTVVSTTGPIYMQEIVPLLCLAVTDGGVSASAWLKRGGAEQAQRMVVGVILAGTITSIVMFVPLQLRSILRASILRGEAETLVMEKSSSRNLVFANLLVDPGQGLSWAYFPPNPRPDFGEDMVYLRALPGALGYQRMLQLWQTKFPDRRAFVVYTTAEGQHVLELPHGEGEGPPPNALWPEMR